MTDVADMLFIHVPKFSSYYKPYGEYMTINLLPMGTWVLADLAAQHGYKTEVLHLGLEWIERGTFSPMNYLRGKDVKVIAIPLHWHQQSYDVMRVGDEIKREKPSTSIVLGGYTASFFHREILSSFPQVDAVIRGDAEVPLLTLMEAIKEGKNWEKVPNLTWREGEEIRENPLSFVAAEGDLDRASYTNLPLLKEWKGYMYYMGMPFIWAKGLSKRQNRKYFHLGLTMFPLNTGRGCLGDCTWCGGGAEAQRMINGRRGVVFRSPEVVAETVANVVELGYEMIHIAFDPGKEGEKYYRHLFPLIRERNLRVKCYFECFSLPSESFLQSFAETFIGNGSVIALSPDSGDERIRYRNKAFPYSNEGLMRTLSLAERLGIKVDIFFTMGIPGERYNDLAKTVALRREIKRRFKNIGRIWTSSISLEPASPWHLHPEAFGIISTRQSFADFYRESSPGEGGLGYSIPDYLENGGTLDGEAFENTLRKAKCRDHCSVHPNPSKASNPFWGRLYCRYLGWRVGGGRD
jgi:radical SAM superfamily enzyme YgiQ (UPF0313 family)